MFHYPNIDLTESQAEAIGLPLIRRRTAGQKEEELKDLAGALEESKASMKIEGIVSGAIDSDYQKSRIDRSAHEAGLKSFAPLWRKNPTQLLSDQFLAGFKSIICGVYAHGFDKTWLGRSLNEETIQALSKLKERFGIHPSGEGGEYETLVLDGPIFKQELCIDQDSEEWNPSTKTGTYTVLRSHLLAPAKSGSLARGR